MEEDELVEELDIKLTIEWREDENNDRSESEAENEQNRSKIDAVSEGNWTGPCYYRWR